MHHPKPEPGQSGFFGGMFSSKNVSNEGSSQLDSQLDKRIYGFMLKKEGRSFQQRIMKKKTKGKDSMQYSVKGS